MPRENTTVPAWMRSLSHARVVGSLPAPNARDVDLDSRAVTSGVVFVAVPGATVDGHAFLAAALERGAVAAIVQEDRRSAWEAFAGELPLVAVPDTRIAAAEAAAGCHGHPARSLGMVGVTGTDGKTTTTHLTAHVLTACGLPAGYLSSVAFGLPASAALNATHMTTVEAPAVQRHLARIRDAGGRYAVVEASSHGLDMHRVDHCEFDVGVFTNLAPDHLDYHETMERYRDAKAELFRMLDNSIDKRLAKAAVVNADDSASEYMRSQTQQHAITYGLGPDADLTATNINTSLNSTSFQLHLSANAPVPSQGDRRVAAGGGRGLGPATLPLLGEFNVYNAIAAIGVAMSQGMDPAAAVEALASFPGVPGRMELIDEGQPFRVIVDIASTEQAMRNVLKVLRPTTSGRLIVVFGAAGERDRERRSGIARSVAEAADHAVITNEDPRSEDPDAIIDEIAAALSAAGFDSRRVDRIPDRRDALTRAFAMARGDDTVLLAGKGTEQSIVIGTTHHPWDERAVARDLLRERWA